VVSDVLFSFFSFLVRCFGPLDMYSRCENVDTRGRPGCELKICKYGVWTTDLESVYEVATVSRNTRL
jgi:hypothetical protein